VNGSNRDDTPLGQLMRDFHCKKSGEMKYKDLADTVRYYKEDEGGYNMCKLMEDYTAKKMRTAHEEGELKGKIEGKREGKKEGENAKARETARKMIAKGMDFNEIAELVGLSVAQVEELAKENK
jgi:predicted transposase/invertase (TIGR01784 family)